MSDRDAERFEAAVAAAERERAEALPGDVQQRLAEMRREAVAEMDAPRSAAAWRWAVPGAVAAAFALAMVVQLYPVGGPTVPPLPELDETQLLAAEEMELLEDLEFVAWMAEEVDAG